MNETAFDSVAADYDSAFTNSLIGKEQRQVTNRLLDRFLSDKSKLSILEINCGTGEDAFWLAAKGHDVIATDISVAMIREAEMKLNDSANPIFLCCGFDGIENLFPTQQFDLIFSNFAGLNCISATELRKLSVALKKLLKPGGHLAIVVFGKNSWWETLVFFLKGKPRQAFRRWSNKKSMARLNGDHHQPVYYHSAGRLEKIFAPLKLIEKKPVGLFIPPSYLEGSMKKRPNLFRSLIKMENRSANLGFLSSFADHVWMTFKK